MRIELFYGLEQSRSSIGPATLQNDLIKILATIDSERSIKRAAEKLGTSWKCTEVGSDFRVNVSES